MFAGRLSMVTPWDEADTRKKVNHMNRSYLGEECSSVQLSPMAVCDSPLRRAGEGVQASQLNALHRGLNGSMKLITGCFLGQ